MKLCFGTVTKTSVDNIPMFRYCWPGPLDFSFCAPASKQTGGGQETGRWHSQDSRPKLAKRHSIPQNITFSNKKEASSFQGSCYLYRTSVCVWEVVNNRLSLHHLFLSLFFSLPFIKLSLCQSTSTSSILILILLGLGEWARGWLGCWLGSTHQTQ